MLESFYRAYKANAFTEENSYPVTFTKIQKYLLILLPSYQFNLIMQKDKSSIADVLPLLDIMLSKWIRMDLFGEYNVLRNNLIAAFKHKFSYEIKSNIYNVASLLNISKLKLWYNRKDCLSIRQSAHLNLIQVRNLFDKKKEIQEPHTQTSNKENVNQSDSNDSLAGFLCDDNYQQNSEIESEIKTTIIENEKIEFYQIIENNDFGTTSTKTFWMNNKEKLPHLKDLAEILLNIPSSAAFIERYYSLCGNVCKTKCGNMGKDQIIKRSLLKANIAIVKQLSKN
jgi:hypothetical protein